jgi:hypothetical protein
VSYTGRYYDHVASLDFDRLAFGPAECDSRGAAYHAKHFVGVRVVVMIGEDAVHPRAAPAVLREQFLAARGVLLGTVERLRVYEQRQRRVVRDATIVLEEIFLYFGLLNPLIHLILLTVWFEVFGVRTMVKAQYGRRLVG